MVYILPTVVVWGALGPDPCGTLGEGFAAGRGFGGRVAAVSVCLLVAARTGYCCCGSIERNAVVVVVGQLVGGACYET